MSIVTVVRVYLKEDMRRLHAMRVRGQKRLGHAEVSLFVNERRTIARLVDSFGGIHSYYADPGYKFDLKAISEAVSVLGLRLETRAASPRLRKAA